MQCISPVVALFVKSLQYTNSGAIGGTADMPTAHFRALATEIERATLLSSE